MNEMNEISVMKPYQEIIVVCPVCSASKKLKIPVEVIKQSKKLTTISIPSKLCCEHSFQSFVDNDYKVRGYQKVDFEITHVEYAEYDPIAIFSSKPLFQELITVLRSYTDGKEILGTGIFTLEGHILFSSIYDNTMFLIIEELEVRTKKKLTRLKKLYLELENKQKIALIYHQIEGMKFVSVLFFSDEVRVGKANYFVNDYIKELKKLGI
jgi:hypothetical protein